MGQTNYVSLLNELAPSFEEGGQVARFVTFNYDRLLEYAVQDVYGKRFRDIDDYISSPELHLYKPHGSVNWSQAAKLAWRAHGLEIRIQRTCFTVSSS